MDKKLAIIGAGGHGKVVADAARSMQVWKNITFFDDIVPVNEIIIADIRNSGSISDLANIFLPRQYDVVVAIGCNKIRKDYIEKFLALGFSLPNIIHSTAYISSLAQIGDGNVFFAKVVVNPGCVIGNGCIVNTSSSIDHDCIIEDFVHISPGAHLAGGTSVGLGSWVGIGACTKQQVHIGCNVIVGAGTVVINDVDSNCTVVGNPAKKLERKG
ncbi:acetyltransferase [Conchiformibius steedae DSM 2580]|uniref:Acetyltransferase n=1 Tax=Conchiformibius steedae DSM 2580 TaxID=1121352 RepID=A0AAE9HSC4_9NEIS|nr:acetyltransferase [Conchiformibius steedae]QMT34417.1 acetyltransferase [Conchiformibius steedae]URD67197.1 acetyltransferase [Conchiformibius steedae DSM 2580]